MVAKEYFLELSEFHKSKVRYKIEEACYIENVVLIHKNHIQQINFRVVLIVVLVLSVTDIFMPARDGIQRFAIR